MSGRPRRLRVLALASYPYEAASTRYRLVQFIEPLRERGIDVEFLPFLDRHLFAALYVPRKLLLAAPRLAWRTLARLGVLLRAFRADAVFVQREALLAGPPLLEWAIARMVRKPLVLDLDDPTWITYRSPVYGRLAPALKFARKTNALIRWSRMVVCGNQRIADHVARFGTESVVVPTVVDLSRFIPRDHQNPLPVVGWIGTHGTWPYLRSILPLLAEVAREEPFLLRIIGSGERSIELPGVRIELHPWTLEREVDDFQSLDIGLYPLIDDRWSGGKSGFKAVQYMAVGVPAIVAPVGVCGTLGIPGTTHFPAATPDEWRARLLELLRHPDLRRSMGAAARRYAEEHFSHQRAADTLAEVFRRVTA